MKQRLLRLIMVTAGAVAILTYFLWHKEPLPSREEVNETLNALAVAIHQGQPLTEAIKHAISQATNPRLKRAWENVLDLVSQGRSLSRSMSVHKDVFPEDLIDVILQGELKGNVDLALMQYVSKHKR